MLIDCFLGLSTYLKVNSNSCNYMTPNYDSITPLVSAVHGQTPFPWACFDYVWFVRSLIILQLPSKSQAFISKLWVTWWRIWLRQCLISQKIAGSINSQVLAPRALVCIPMRNWSFERQMGTGEIRYPLHLHDVYPPHVYVVVMLCQPPHVLQFNFSQFSPSLPWQRQLQTESWFSIPSHSLLDA